jgi:predicted MPP superfamily phosphohydrolase
VIGNHDEEDIHWTGMRAFLEQKGIKFLEKPDDMQFVKIDEGIICIHGIHTLTDRLHTLWKKECDNLMDKYIEKLTTTKTDLHIVLIHNPDGLEFLLQRLKKTHKKLTTPTLFFAGHTHGASIDLPFIRRLDLWLCHTIFNRYKWWYTPDAKNSDTGNWKLYVSTGMGSAPGFDFRINAKPEVVLFTL